MTKRIRSKLRRVDGILWSPLKMDDENEDIADRREYFSEMDKAASHSMMKSGVEPVDGYVSTRRKPGPKPRKRREGETLKKVRLMQRRAWTPSVGKGNAYNEEDVIAAMQVDAFYTDLREEMIKIREQAEEDLITQRVNICVEYRRRLMGCLFKMEDPAIADQINEDLGAVDMMINDAADELGVCYADLIREPAAKLRRRTNEIDAKVRELLYKCYVEMDLPLNVIGILFGYTTRKGVEDAIGWHAKRIGVKDPVPTHTGDKYSANRWPYGMGRGNLGLV